MFNRVMQTVSAGKRACMQLACMDLGIDMPSISFADDMLAVLTMLLAIPWSILP